MYEGYAPREELRVERHHSFWSGTDMLRLEWILSFCVFKDGWAHLQSCRVDKQTGVGTGGYLCCLLSHTHNY